MDQKHKKEGVQLFPVIFSFMYKIVNTATYEYIVRQLNYVILYKK